MIRARHLSKRFRCYTHPFELVKELVTFKPHHTVLNVLDDVSFDVSRGECVGIIGPNGGGKSTLLKILIGVLLPNAGTVDIDGRITGLLELGTGFNQEMTGLQNIFLNGLLLGMTRKEIERRRERIIEFTELGDFIRAPLKTYSSGMIMRLAFSVAIHADPACFVIDEALAVGDAHFQQKCFKRILEFKESGGSILFVSHDMHTVKRLCDRAILLHDGKFQHQGDPDEVINQYNYLLSTVHDSAGQVKRDESKDLSYGTFEARIVNVACLGRYSGSPILRSGEDAVITIGIRAEKDLDDVTCGITIRDQFGQDMFGTNTWLHGMRIRLEAGKEYRIAFRAPMAFGEGKYTISPALHTGVDHVSHCYHWMENAASFEVTGTAGFRFLGTCNLRPEIDVKMLDGEDGVVIASAGWKPE